MNTLCVCSLVLLLCTSAPAAAATGDAATGDAATGDAATGEHNGFITQGGLLVNRESKVVKVPLKHTDVRIQVSGYLAEATVTQTFENPYPDKIEAIYVFPLPTNAAVSALSIKNGSRVIRGSILLKAKASAIYRKATLAGKVSALLTQQRPNLFTQQVANLEPGKTVEVQIRYTNTLRYDAGTYELVFPMVAGPRFMPRKKGRAGRPKLLSPPVLPPDLRSAHDIDLDVTLDAGLPIEAIRSSSHRIRVSNSSDSSAEVTINGGDRIPNRDFVLRYRVAGKRPRAAVLSHRPLENKPGALLLMVQPPEGKSAYRAVPRELILVLDTSSSMSGSPLGKAKELVRRLLSGLKPQDTFQIVRFADRASSLGPKMIANRASNLKLALAWLDRLQAAGGTRMAPGIFSALAFPHDAGRLRLVVLVTDGYIGNEEEILSQTKRRLGAARIFAFGVGTAVNRYLLEEMAGLGRGMVQVVRPDEPTGQVVKRLEQRLSRPLLTDLSVEYQNLKVTSQLPSRLPDLFAGQPLFLHARYSGSGPGTVILRGQRQGKPVQMRIPVHLPRRQTKHRAVALAWGRVSIAALQRQLLIKNDATIKEQITELALAHGLLCPYTAFVAVDQESFSEGEAIKVRVPVDRPQYMMRGLAAGGLLGSAIGSSFGLGGMGLAGTGSGGGGVGYGAVGTGSLSAFGKGGAGGSGSGYGRLSGRAATVPRIVVGRTEVRGALDKEIIRRVIRRHLNEVRYCYEKELQANPKLAGRMVVTFTITESGQVPVSAVRSSTLKNTAVERCVASAVRRWQFPKVKGGGISVVSYPYVFKPTQQEKGPTTPITPHGRR